MLKRRMRNFLAEHCSSCSALASWNASSSSPPRCGISSGATTSAWYCLGRALKSNAGLRPRSSLLIQPFKERRRIWTLHVSFLPEGGIEKVLAARWDDKLQAVLGAGSQAHGRMIGRLRDIKERIRNPFAHGGTENDRGSIYCHIPGVGTIPGNMSRTKNSAHFKCS